MLPFAISASHELSVDPVLGYPPAFAALCSRRPPLFLASPPLCFLPYPLSDEQAARWRELDAMFPVIKIEETRRENECAKRRLKRSHAEHLWPHLHHLGNAGFDPAEFRIDPYGNVLHWNAHPSSPLAWDVDHWFPQSRGGKTVGTNLRLVQWQVSLRKGQNLEFLMPWWDLQLGVSVAQFLLIHASNNSDFRHRAFCLLFQRVHDGNTHLQKHKWPMQFKRKSERHGYGAAAVVRVNNGLSDASSDTAKGHDLQWNWSRTIETEEAWTGDMKHEGEGEALEMEKPHPEPYDKRTVKDQIVQELAEGLMERCSLRSSSITMEEKQRIASRELHREIERKKEEVLLMERELNAIRHHNERERMVLGDLESTLEKHKRQLEKQRHWSETQSHYRKCLERIIRDTLHQSFIFKEQTKINQAACSALLAKIKSYKTECENAEADLMRRAKQRRALEILAHLDLDSACQRLAQEGLTSSREGWDHENAAMAADKVLGVDHVHSRTDEMPTKCMDTIAEEEGELKEAETEQLLCKSPLKRKVASEEDGARHGYQRQRIETEFHGAVVGYKERGNGGGYVEDDGELLQEMLTERRGEDFSGSADDVPTVPETEEERMRRLGKTTLDKWLQKLLLNSISSEDHADKSSADGSKQSADKDDRWKQNPEEEKSEGNVVRNEERSRNVLDGLFRAMSFRQYSGSKKLKISTENSRADRAQRHVENDEAREEQGSRGHRMADKEEIRVEGNEDVHLLIDTDPKECNMDGAVFTASDVDFVKRMREIRDKERRKQRSRQGAHQWRSGGMHSQSRSRRLHQVQHHHDQAKDDGMVMTTRDQNSARMHPQSWSNEVQDQHPRDLAKDNGMVMTTRDQNSAAEGRMHPQSSSNEVQVEHPQDQANDNGMVLTTGDKNSVAGRRMHPQSWSNKVQGQHLQDQVKEAEDNHVMVMTRDQSSAAAVCISSDTIPVSSTQLKRCHSMRAPPNDRWILHTRRGSELVNPSLAHPNEKEKEINLHPSQSLPTEDDADEGHRKSLSFKDSLKTCTNAWKLAVSQQHRKSAKKRQIP